MKAYQDSRDALYCGGDVAALPVIHRKDLNHMKVRILVLALLVAGLIAPSAAVARQMSAGERPDTAGPISTRRALQSCETRVSRRDGETVAVTKVCAGFWLFDPDRESSPRRNYGAFWVQMTVDSRRPWCTEWSRLDLRGLKRPGVHSTTPRIGRDVRTGVTRRYTTRLLIDAQGNTHRPATIKNSFDVYPRAMIVSKRDDGSTLRMRWTGSTRRKIAFASGAELSWIPGRAFPQITPEFSSFFTRRGEC
jgi:hypothetical protein